jgi:uncharacterized OB-fold protein
MTTSTGSPKPPVPAPDEASRPFFEGAAAGKLMLMRCARCGTYRYPARDRCDECWSTDTEWVEASGRGTLHSWVIFHQVYHPGFADRVPYNVAIVELDEGPRTTSNIVECDNADLYAGMPVRVTFENVAEGVALPRFQPADA